MRPVAKRLWGVCTAGAATLACLPGCELTRAGHGPAPTMGELAQHRNPFAPTAIRIYPLTHLLRDPEHGDIIMCHVELKDRWGDPVKALGWLELQLFTSPYDPASESRQERVWPVDEMAQPEVNSALFDPATRTYRLRLGSLPQWVRDMITRREAVERGEATTIPRRRLILHAVFRTMNEHGEEIMLLDRYVIEH